MKLYTGEAQGPSKIPLITSLDMSLAIKPVIVGQEQGLERVLHIDRVNQPYCDLYSLGTQSFGSESNFHQWLTKPLPYFNLDLIKSNTSFEALEKLYTLQYNSDATRPSDYLYSKEGCLFLIETLNYLNYNERNS